MKVGDKVYFLDFKHKHNHKPTTLVEIREIDKEGNFDILPLPYHMTYVKVTEDMLYESEEDALRYYKAKLLKDYKKELDDFCSGIYTKRHQPQVRDIKPQHILKDTRYRDEQGEMIWFPKDERPYFDKALQKTFHSKKEKCEYMRKNHLVMKGDSNPKKWPIESGDLRSRSYRKANKLQD